jgi:phage portal protein BeeE
MREDIDQIQSGPENSGRPWLLPPGLDVESIGQTAVEVQLLEQRSVNKTEAIALYGLTPATQGVIERSAELPEQRQMAVQEGLAPALILIEACLTAQVCWGMLKEPDLFVAFDFSQILRGDFLREVEGLSRAVQSALYTPNEGRDQLGKPRINLKGMDEPWLPRNNVWPLGEPFQPKGGGQPETTPPGEPSGVGAGEHEGE